MNEQDKKAFVAAFKENSWYDNMDAEEIWKAALEYARWQQEPVALGPLMFDILKRYPTVSGTEFEQFLHDVYTAAGLVRHGNQSKALADRLGKTVSRLLLNSAPPKIPPETKNLWVMKSNPSLVLPALLPCHDPKDFVHYSAAPAQPVQPVNEQLLEALKNLRNEVVEYYGEKEFSLPHADAAIASAEAAKGGV